MPFVGELVLSAEHARQRGRLFIRETLCDSGPRRAGKQVPTLELAAPHRLERDQLLGCECCKRDVLRDLVLPIVLFEISRVHALEIEVEPLACQQTFLQGVPVTELNEIRVCRSQPELETVRAFRALRHVVCQLIARKVEARYLTDRPVVQLLTAVLLAQECACFLGVFDLELVVALFVLGDRFTNLSGEDLLADLSELVIREILL